MKQSNTALWVLLGSLTLAGCGSTSGERAPAGETENAGMIGLSLNVGGGVVLNSQS